MKLSKPKKSTYTIALILALLTLAARLVPVIRDFIPPIILKYDFWIMTIAYILLLMSTTFKRL